MSGYRTVKRAGRSYLEHRLVWEAAHGPIPSGMQVHHKNGNKRDNRLENLELMTPRDHSEHHNAIHPKRVLCRHCGREFEPPVKRRARLKTCSRVCFSALMSTQKRGGANPQSRLTATMVLEARRRRKDGERLKDLCVEYGVSQSALSQAVNGATWAHL